MTTHHASAAEIDFSTVLRAGDGLVWGQACAEPTTLVRRLMHQADAVPGVTAFVGIPGSGAIAERAPGNIRFSSYTGSGINARLHDEGVLDILPAHYSALPRLIATGAIRADVVLLRLAPPDARGRYSLGTAHEYLGAALDTAREIIVEVDPQAPWVCGERVLHEFQLSRVVHPPGQALGRTSPAADDDVRTAIAENAAALVDDGSTLQIGIGRLPDAVVARLGDRTGLGVHSGNIGDAVADLMESGVIDGSRKIIDVGLTVTGAIIGGPRLMSFVHRNSAVRLRSTVYTHDPAVLARQPKLISINSALEVDLSGQVNSESVGGRYLGAVGGALDFTLAANRSPGGFPVVALPSTVRGKSTIVNRLNGPATIPRSEVGIIVTEHGHADLRGLTLDRRRERLLAICDPALREDLESA
jgi:acetyl-CoA hydrolase